MPYTGCIAAGATTGCRRLHAVNSSCEHPAPPLPPSSMGLGHFSVGGMYGRLGKGIEPWIIRHNYCTSNLQLCLQLHYALLPSFLMHKSEFQHEVTRLHTELLMPQGRPSTGRLHVYMMVMAAVALHCIALQLRCKCCICDDADAASSTFLSECQCFCPRIPPIADWNCNSHTGTNSGALLSTLNADLRGNRHAQASQSLFRHFTKYKMQELPEMLGSMWGHISDEADSIERYAQARHAKGCAFSRGFSCLPGCPSET